MREKSDTPDLEVARIATRQHGVVSTGQLVAAGVGKNAITRRVKRGQLHRLHQGIYAVGHAGVSLQGRWMAAVLACGHGVVLSHGSAAVHWELLRPIDGPSTSRCRRPTDGAGEGASGSIAAHRSSLHEG